MIPAHGSMILCKSTRAAGLPRRPPNESAGCAAIIEEGLRDVGLTDTVVLTDRHALLARLEALAPEVVLIDLEKPSRDVLEEYFAVSRALARPIAMFVDQSDEQATAAAVDAGVSAYIVAVLSRNRIKPILDLAVRRFEAFSRLRAELHEARTALEDRATIDRAKAILTRRRHLDEPAAYALLRRHAVASKRRIVEVAQAIVTAEALIGDLP